MSCGVGPMLLTRYEVVGSGSVCRRGCCGPGNGGAMPDAEDLADLLRDAAQVLERLASTSGSPSSACCAPR